MKIFVPLSMQHWVPVFLLTVTFGCFGEASKDFSFGRPADEVERLVTEKESSPVAVAPATASSVTPGTADDEAVVRELEGLGVTLKKNPAGQVVAADCKYAAVGDEQAALFTKLHSLKVLSLENSSISNDGLKFVEQMRSLQELGLRRCTNVDDAGLAALQLIPNLERLHLLYTRTSDEGLKQVSQLKKLKLLDLRGCMQVTDAGLAHLEGLTELTDIKLRSYSVTDLGMNSLAKLTNLRTVSLEDCSVADDGMVPLLTLKKLRVLNLMRTAVGDAGLAHFSEMPLVTLNLRDTAVSGPGLDSLAAARETLTTLDLSELRINNAGVAHISSFKNLQNLDLWNASIDRDGIALLTPLAGLKSLNLEGCRDVNSDAAKELVKLTKLESLNLAETGVDDSGLKQLGELQRLKELVIFRADVTSDGIDNFQQANPHCAIRQ
ncbi:leucine-rich repeat domain-containing protein [Planctomicrobium sp. SH661]|uniref:leucine-rich repeat domain-containing protein n=1 Tax=Planctomicrobium sp. SH661 TaxID=3448124 RepID=UPI003F5BBA11